MERKESNVRVHAFKDIYTNDQIKLGDDWTAFRMKNNSRGNCSSIQVTDQFPLFSPCGIYLSISSHLFGLFGPSCNVNKKN